MKKLLFICLLVVLSACSKQDSRFNLMQDLTKDSGLKKAIVKTDYFSMFSLYKGTKGTSNTVRIYLEGDGFAWKTRRVISDDPTPNNPVAMRLALNDYSDMVLYVARPCQYMMEYGFGDRCDKDVWSFDRFSGKNLVSLNQVINKYKKELRFKNIELIGYSGGGTMAMLLPLLRNDITKITTVAGNLDIDEWVSHHKISPLDGSLNPANYKQKLVDIPQVHYVGKNDAIIPSYITYSFIEGMNDAEVIEVDTTHGDWDL